MRPQSGRSASEAPRGTPWHRAAYPGTARQGRCAPVAHLHLRVICWANHAGERRLEQ